MKKEFVNRCAIFIQINFRSTKFEKWLAGTEFTMIQEPRPCAESAITMSNLQTFSKYTKYYLEHYGYYNWTDISIPPLEITNFS